MLKAVESLRRNTAGEKGRMETRGQKGSRVSLLEKGKKDMMRERKSNRLQLVNERGGKAGGPWGSVDSQMSVTT